MADFDAEDPWFDRYAARWVREHLDSVLQDVDDTSFAPSALDVADEAAAVIEDWMEALVVLSRDYDFSWEDISMGLRITRQTAWNRWRGLAPDKTDDPAVIELLVGLGAERQLRRRKDFTEIKDLVTAAGEQIGDREAIIRFIQRRASERATTSG